MRVPSSRAPRLIAATLTAGLALTAIGCNQAQNIRGIKIWIGDSQQAAPHPVYKALQEANFTMPLRPVVVSLTKPTTRRCGHRGARPAQSRDQGIAGENKPAHQG